MSFLGDFSSHTLKEESRDCFKYLTVMSVMGGPQEVLEVYKYHSLFNMTLNVVSNQHLSHNSPRSPSEGTLN